MFSCLAVLGDANFPATSTCQHGAKAIRADGLSIPELLKSILQLFPLDLHAPPIYLMDLEPQDKARKLATPVWQEYKTIVESVSGGEYPKVDFVTLERSKFYERAKKAYAVVATGEAALYGNIILKKGVIP